MCEWCVADSQSLAVKSRRPLYLSALERLHPQHAHPVARAVLGDEAVEHPVDVRRRRNLRRDVTILRQIGGAPQFCDDAPGERSSGQPDGPSQP